MKNLTLALFIAIISCTNLRAQVVLFSEDFSTATGTTPPTGWDQMVFAGDPIVDLWSFDNPGSRVLNPPLSTPVAIFDSDFYSNNSLPEDVALQSPVFSALGHSTILLKFEHYFQSISPSAYNVEVFNGSGWISVLSGTASTSNPQTELINVSAQLVNVPNARVRFRYEGNYSWFWFVDNIEVIATGTSDLRVASIENLNTSCSFGTNEQVRVLVENLGTATQDTFDVAYSLNGGAIITEAYTGPPIMPGMAATYTFAATEDLSAVGTYNIQAYTALNGDSNTSNDTTKQVFQNLGTSPQALPYLENFNAFSITTPGVFINGWINAGPNDWLANSGPTATNTTGPNSDNGTGNGIYLYTEATGQAQGDEFVLQSPCIDISALAFLSYFYHMFGDDMGSLELFVVSNGVSTRMDSIGGQQQLSSMASWRESIINLGSFVGQSIYLEFRGKIGNGASSDIALDDVSIFFPSGKDLGLTASISPVDSQDCFGTNESLSYLLTNFGGDTLDFSQDTTTLTLMLTGANAGTYLLELDSGKIAPLQSLQVTFHGVNLVNPGTTQAEASLSLSGDSQTSNNTLGRTLDTQLPESLPFLEDFEAFVVDTFGLFSGNWKNDGLGDRNWYANRANTSTNNTGPESDNGPGNGVYLFTEATFPSVEEDQFRLQTPCLDLSGSNATQLSYYYHMYGIGMGRLEVFVVQNRMEIKVDSLIGQQQSSGFDPFLERVVDLSAFSGRIRIEFRGTRGSTSQSDMAIDDVEVRDVSIPDLSLEGAINDGNANSFGCFGANESFTLSLKNNGATLDFGQDPTQIVLEASGANSFRDTLNLNNGTINLREVQTFSFANLDLSNAGTTFLNFFLLNGTDPGPQNDSLILEVLTQPIISKFPYVEDFELGNGGFAASGTRSTWALGTPNKVRIKGAFSGTQAWTTGGLGGGNYNSLENSQVYSPCFDFSGVDEDLFAVLYYWLDAETDFDGAILQSSTDAGQSWQNIGDFGDPNDWYNSNQITAEPGNAQGLGWTGNGTQGTNGYVQAYHKLDSSLLGKQDVRFRIAFAADGDVELNGFAFDNFAISAFPKVDLGEDGTTLCIGEGLDAGNLGSSFQWSTGDSSQKVLIPDSTGASVDDSLIFVTVTNEAGLSTSDTIKVNIRFGLPPELRTSNLLDANCANDSTGAVFLDFSGTATPFTFAWNTGEQTEDITLIPPGTYNLTVVDTLGCSFVSNDFEIGFLDSLPQTPQITQVAVVGSVVSFETDSVEGLTYTWFFGDGSSPSNERNPNHFFEVNGQYIVSLTVTNSCGSTTVFDTVNMTTVGLNELLATSVSIYPNPNQGIFSLKIEGSSVFDLELGVYDLNGKQVFSQSVGKQASATDIQVELPSGLSQGMYVLKAKIRGEVLYRRFYLE